MHAYFNPLIGMGFCLEVGERLDGEELRILLPWCLKVCSQDPCEKEGSG